MRILFLALSSLALAQTPAIDAGGIVNNADLMTTTLAPGSLFSIFGKNLASRMAVFDTVPFSASLGGVTVKFVTDQTTVNVPLRYVQPDDPAHSVESQINAQVPWNLVPNGVTATVNVIVSHDNLSSPPTPVTVGPFSPAVFGSYPDRRGIVVNTVDGTYAWPSGSVPGLVTHPAKPGDLVIVYATGLGALDSPIADGADSHDKLRNVLTKPVVLVGGLSAEVPFAGLSPQYPGVYQLNVVIPNAAPGDSVPIQIQVGGLTSTSTITMAVGQ